MGLTEITLVFFLETIDEHTRKKYEVNYVDPKSRVTVIPVFIQPSCEETPI